MAIRTLLALSVAAGALAACQQSDGNKAANGNASAGAAAAPKEQPKGTILDTVSKSGDHSVLANAVNSAGLTGTLSGAGPYTLFAPTDAAFGKLPGGGANALLAPEAKGRLVALLSGHIVPGVVTAQDLSRAIDKGKGKAQIATVGGVKLSFTKAGDAIVVADAKGGRARIADADLLQSNGVVHSIDGVLAPQ
jgi:uncharacterized surface protein with fasciclin (FAS1) repeats